MTKQNENNSLDTYYNSFLNQNTKFNILIILYYKPINILLLQSPTRHKMLKAFWKVHSELQIKMITSENTKQRQLHNAMEQ